MSVVIVGGHDRMVHQYKKICKEYKCKAKVFTQMSGILSLKKIKKRTRKCTLLISLSFLSLFI